MTQRIEKVIKGILADPKLTYLQKLTALAGAAENAPDPIPFSRETQWFADRDIVFDMGEGNAPYRPRYVLPDYGKFMRRGSRFLMLDPPGGIWDTVSDLLTLYRHVPLVIAGPVYISYIDRPLDSFVRDEEEACHAIRIFPTHVGHTISDSFCHAGIRPYSTEAGRIIPELSTQTQHLVSNMSLVRSEHTTDEFACKAVEAGLITARLSFMNDAMHIADWGRKCAIMSCYNALPIRGGRLTLRQLSMRKLGDVAENREHLPDRLLPATVATQCEQMDERDTYILEQGRSLENIFLRSEGLIHRDKFMGMSGMVGLTECVNTVLKLEKPGKRYRYGRKAREFTLLTLDRMYEQIKAYKPKYGRFEMYGQVGIATDTEATPNIRIPAGGEPSPHDQLLSMALTQKYSATGIGKLFPLGETAKKNPIAVLDTIKRTFGEGMRYFSFYSSSSDVVYVTDYLVKRSDIERFDAEEACLGNSTVLGSGASGGLHIFGRSMRQVPQEKD